MPLETEATAELRALLADIKPDNTDLLGALHRVQHHYGYVSAEAMRVIAEQLRVSVAHVYGATTYYADFRTTPPPRTNIGWCSGPACRLRNSVGIRDAMLATLGIAMGGQTDDGVVGVTQMQCNGSCEQAPQVWVGEAVVGRLNAARAIRLARALRDGADASVVIGEAASTNGGGH